MKIDKKITNVIFVDTLICPEKSCVLCPRLYYNTRFFRETEIPESKVFFWSDTLYAMNFIFIIFDEALYYHYNLLYQVA